MKKGLIAMFLDQNFPPDIRVEKEIHTLAEAGYEVRLFSVSYIKNKVEEEVRGIKIFRYLGSKLVYKLSALAYTVPIFHYIIKKHAERFVQALKPDFLHVHDMVIAPPVLEIGRKYNIPTVLDLHENRPAIMKLYAHVSKFPGRYLINLNKWKNAQIKLERACDRLILITEEAKKYAAETEGISKEKIYVVPNTVKKDFAENFKESADIKARFKDQFCILYFGDTALRRGTDTMIEAVALLKDKIKNIRAIIVGQGSEDDKLAEKAKDLGVDKMVSLEGWQDIAYLKSYAEISAVGICPFKRNLHHDTTFANKLFQFMGLGLPVIVSDCPSQVNIIEKYHCGLVFKAESSEDLAAKILTLYHEEGLRSKLGENGRKSIQQDMYWEKTARSLSKLYGSFTNR